MAETTTVPPAPGPTDLDDYLWGQFQEITSSEKLKELLAKSPYYVRYFELRDEDNDNKAEILCMILRNLVRPGTTKDAYAARLCPPSPIPSTTTPESLRLGWPGFHQREEQQDAISDKETPRSMELVPDTRILKESNNRRVNELLENYNKNTIPLNLPDDSQGLLAFLNLFSAVNTAIDLFLANDKHRKNWVKLMKKHPDGDRSDPSTSADAVQVTHIGRWMNRLQKAFCLAEFMIRAYQQLHGIYPKPASKVKTLGLRITDQAQKEAFAVMDWFAEDVSHAVGEEAVPFQKEARTKIAQSTGVSRREKGGKVAEPKTPPARVENGVPRELRGLMDFNAPGDRENAPLTKRRRRRA